MAYDDEQLDEEGVKQPPQESLPERVARAGAKGYIKDELGKHIDKKFKKEKPEEPAEKEKPKEGEKGEKGEKEVGAEGKEAETAKEGIEGEKEAVKGAKTGMGKGVKSAEKTAEKGIEEGGKEALKEGGEGAAKTAFETGVRAGVGAGKAFGKKVATTAAKEGGKKVVETGAAAAAPETGGISLIVGFIVEGLDKAGVIDWFINAGIKITKWAAGITLGAILLIIFMIFLLISMFLTSGCGGGGGTTPVDPLNASSRNHYYDVLAVLASNMSRDAKMKLLAMKNAEIVRRLTAEQSALRAVSQTPDVVESIKLIDEMMPHVIAIGNLGKSVYNGEIQNNEGGFAQEKKNKEIKEKEINKEYDAWLQIWEKFKKVYPGFKLPKLMSDYVRALQQRGIDASEPTTAFQKFDAMRFNKLTGIYDRQHVGYDIPQSDGSKVLNGWGPGKVTAIDYWDYKGWKDSCVYVQYKDYEIGYGHIFPSVSVGDTVNAWDSVGIIANGAAHTDIKVRKNGDPWDWGKKPIE